MSNSTTFTVLYFARVAELTGHRSEQWPLEPDLSVAQWLTQLIARYPDLASAESRLKVAVNQFYVPRTHTIQANDEVAVFEPVTGG